MLDELPATAFKEGVKERYIATLTEDRSHLVTRGILANIGVVISDVSEGK
jgi:hypothetical protein